MSQHSLVKRRVLHVCLTKFSLKNLSHCDPHSDASAFRDGIFESKVYGKAIIHAGGSKTAVRKSIGDARRPRKVQGQFADGHKENAGWPIDQTVQALVE
jgi:hypothetical protein